MINTQGGRCGGLQGGFQRAAHNLHFVIFSTIVTTMGVRFVATFEVEAIEQNSEFERRYAMRRFEKLRQ
jgi:hypothetical protein